MCVNWVAFWFVLDKLTAIKNIFNTHYVRNCTLLRVQFLLSIPLIEKSLHSISQLRTGLEFSDCFNLNLYLLTRLWVSAFSFIPDFSPPKFFAGRGAGHEAVVNYCKCLATKQLRKNLLARRVNFLIWNKIQSELWRFSQLIVSYWYCGLNQKVHEEYGLSARMQWLLVGFFSRSGSVLPDNIDGIILPFIIRFYCQVFLSRIKFLLIKNRFLCC